MRTASLGVAGYECMECVDEMLPGLVLEASLLGLLEKGQSPQQVFSAG